jgi:hypothetical protein
VTHEQVLRILEVAVNGVIIDDPWDGTTKDPNLDPRKWLSSSDLDLMERGFMWGFRDSDEHKYCFALWNPGKQLAAVLLSTAAALAVVLETRPK